VAGPTLAEAVGSKILIDGLFDGEAEIGLGRGEAGKVNTEAPDEGAVIGGSGGGQTVFGQLGVDLGIDRAGAGSQRLPRPVIWF